MCKRCEIATGAETSLFGDQGMDSAIQAFEHQFERFEPDTRIAACQRVCPNEHDRSYRRRIERLANANRMTDDNISLKRFDLFPADYFIFESTKPGRDAIRDLA